MQRCLDATGKQVEDDDVVCAAWLSLPEGDDALNDDQALLLPHGAMGVFQRSQVRGNF